MGELMLLDLLSTKVPDMLQFGLTVSYLLVSAGVLMFIIHFITKAITGRHSIFFVEIGYRAVFGGIFFSFLFLVLKILAESVGLI